MKDSTGPVFSGKVAAALHQSWLGLRGEIVEMAVPANETEFEGKAFGTNYRRAQGTKRDGSGRIGGIALPEKMKLGPGETICRLGNRARSADDDRCGPWWMLTSTLQLNAEYAVDLPSLAGLLRQNLAVPPAFNAMDRLFVATLRVSGSSPPHSGAFLS